jgi:hypothetical protein
MTPPFEVLTMGRLDGTNPGSVWLAVPPGLRR